MIYFIEQWNAKPSWKAMSTAERTNYMQQVGTAIQELPEKGVKVLTWSANNISTTQKAAYDYFAIWTFPDRETADHFQELVAEAGWYNYFEQANLMGVENSTENIIGELIAL